MSPNLHAAMMHARAAEIARNAERHHEAPRRERAPKQARTGRAFGLLRLPRHAAN